MKEVKITLTERELSFLYKLIDTALVALDDAETIKDAVKLNSKLHIISIK